jgi:hypothetical protein
MFRSIAAVLGFARFLDRGSIVLKNCHDKIYYQFLELLGHFAKMSFYSGNLYAKFFDFGESLFAFRMELKWAGLEYSSLIFLDASKNKRRRAN